MAYLDYYRTNPNWATSQWQSVAPPAPAFQPQPSWGGLDFFRAVSGLNDSAIYQNAWNRVQNLQSFSQAAPSILDAKIAHRKAYGGLGDIFVMTPNEIGAAAAYEVWRNWRYNYGVLAQPLGGDIPRQREALIGLAVGEAVKLWQYTTRMTDIMGREAAVEAAAVTAASIFEQGNNLLLNGGGMYGGGSMRAGAISPSIPAGSFGGVGVGAVSSAAAGLPAESVIGNTGILSPTPIAANLGIVAPPLVRQRSYSASAGIAPSLSGAGAGGLYGAGNSMLGAGVTGGGMYAGTGGLMGSGAVYSRPRSALDGYAGANYGAGYVGGYGGYGGGYGSGTVGSYNSGIGGYGPGYGSGYGMADGYGSYGNNYNSYGGRSGYGGSGLIGNALAKHERNRARREVERAEYSAMRANRHMNGGFFGRQYGGGGYGRYGGGII